ncbi:hypothetical protein KIW84_063821 [Lathyrus oleraceus]|uniref:Uncharacterized protein n=1 Tax=Pisum sativum TaxID=3888 RepID=A0A9D4W8M3_PEA|nr:hypothetical protein KIW84_063821 [Pisum sativum]
MVKRYTCLVLEISPSLGVTLLPIEIGYLYQSPVILVFKLIDPHDLDVIPVELTIDKFEDRISTKQVWLDPNYDKERDDELLGLESPKLRSDGWLEMEIGEFFNSDVQDEVIQIGVVEIKVGRTKSGFILEGIEIRHKN